MAANLESMARYSCNNCYGFNEKNLGGRCFNAKLKFGASLSRYKCFANRQFNPVKGRAACYYMPQFQAYRRGSPAFCERRTVTPETLVPKVRHCNLDHGKRG